jgi:hypothetical protein
MTSDSWYEAVASAEMITPEHRRGPAGG